MKLTRQQREALKRVFDRQPLIAGNTGALIHNRDDKITRHAVMTYRQFRKTVQPGYDCAMVPWCGMWLGIEKDGYTHS